MEPAGRAALACATEARSSYPGLFAFQPGCILSEGLAFFSCMHMWKHMHEQMDVERSCCKGQLYMTS